MKKLLLEYANLIGYTFTGLIFGLAFALLFINYNHARDIDEIIDVSDNLTATREQVQAKIDTIKANAASYDASTYQGNYVSYDLNNIQLRLNSCVASFESEESQNYLNKTEYSLKDVYDFGEFYQNNILNDCVIMQMNALGSSDSQSINIPSLSYIRPFINLNIKKLMNSPSYIMSNIENADNYQFSNNDNKNTIFSLTRDSYYAILENYNTSLDLVVEVSEWYKNTVIGG